MVYHKKCPPGVICVENMTMGFIIIIICVVVYLIYSSLFKQQTSARNNNNNNNNNTHEKIIIKERNNQANTNGGLFNYFTRPNYAYNNLPKDVLMNPYAPPLNDERYFIPEMMNIPPGRIPINISTNVGAVDTSYRQNGILTLLNGTTKILPLMVLPLFVNRDKWQYYTLSDQNNSIKLPIVKNGRSCTNEYGCDKLYNGDTIYVEGYNQAFKVTTYDTDTIKYLPFL